MHFLDGRSSRGIATELLARRSHPYRRLSATIAKLTVGAMVVCASVIGLSTPMQAVVNTPPVNSPIAVTNCQLTLYDNWVNLGDTFTLTFNTATYAGTSFCVAGNNTALDYTIATISPAIPANYAAWPTGTYTVTALRAGSFNLSLCDSTGGCGGMLRFDVRVVPGTPTTPTVSLSGTTATISTARSGIDAYTSPASFLVTATPGGATCSMSTGNCAISGLTPGTAYTFRATATNSAGTSDPSAASLGVTPESLPVLTAGTPPTTATVGAAYSYTFAASGYPVPTYSVQSGALPTGLTLNSTTGVLSGTPTAVGSFTFVVRATNTAGGVNSASITAVIASTSPAPAPAPAPAPEPASEPSPTASATSTPTPTPTASVATVLGPVTNASNSGVPAGGVAQGTGILIVNGEKVLVTVNPDERDVRLLEVSGPGFTMSLAGLNAQGKPLGLTPDGALILEQDRTAAVAGTGFQPNSLVYLYLFSEPRLLGTVQTDANGTFKGQVPLPADIADGRHTLQSNGFTPDGTVRSLSLGVVMATPVVALPKQATTMVYFESLSSVLTDEGRSTLKALVKKTGKKDVRTLSIGYVQGTTITANDEALSTQRAKSVAAYLKKLGLKGRFVVRGDGIAKESGPAARRVNVSVNYLK